jgi:hypothetical protein
MDETKSGAGRGVLVIAPVVGAFITVATSPARFAPASSPDRGRSQARPSPGTPDNQPRHRGYARLHGGAALPPVYDAFSWAVRVVNESRPAGYPNAYAPLNTSVAERITVELTD